MNNIIKSIAEIQSTVFEYWRVSMDSYYKTCVNPIVKSWSNDESNK